MASMVIERAAIGGAAGVESLGDGDFACSHMVVRWLLLLLLLLLPALHLFAHVREPYDECRVWTSRARSLVAALPLLSAVTAADYCGSCLCWDEIHCTCAPRIVMLGIPSFIDRDAGVEPPLPRRICFGAGGSSVVDICRWRPACGGWLQAHIRAARRRRITKKSCAHARLPRESIRGRCGMRQVSVGWVYSPLLRCTPTKRLLGLAGWTPLRIHGVQLPRKLIPRSGRLWPLAALCDTALLAS